MSNHDKIIETKYTDENIKQCIALLETLHGDYSQFALISEELRINLMSAAGRFSRPERTESRKRKRAIKKLERRRIVKSERKARALTGIRTAREALVFVAPLQISADIARNHELKELNSPRDCYVCKAPFTRLHFFYDSMCPACAEFNYAKRFQTAPLHGQVVLITGSRLKIGYQSTLMMLRAGATVIATTRFPIDSALRYSREQDFSKWADRLHIYGLDLRHTPSVEIFCSYIEQTYDRLDILINNAAQTVRRPPGFYAHLLETEMRDFKDLPEAVQILLRPFAECKRKLLSLTQTSSTGESGMAITWNAKAPGVGLRASAQLSQVPYTHDHNLPAEKVFPKGKLDADLQQVDLRDVNSWRLRLGQVPTAELIEIQLVNAIAPFVLCNRLSMMMKRQNTGLKHIVNVSAMEGKFHRFVKTDRHPHTNMAKAALNMLTHTSASDLVKDGIYMNSVDTGWVTDEDPAALSKRKQEEHDFQPPLDIVDGAARVCDPFFDGILTGKHWCGKFLKDYFPIEW